MKNEEEVTDKSATKSKNKIFSWTLTSATLGFIAWTLSNGPTALQNLRNLPNEIVKTWSAYSSWLHEDSEWTGAWSASPEGHVNAAEMALSDSNLVITLSSSRGKIDGTIASKSLCRELPFFNFVLAEGEVSTFGGNAEIKAYDYIGGKRIELASLALRRRGAVMQVIFEDGPMQVIDSPVRIARNPRNSDSEEPQPDHEYCAEERRAFFKRIASDSIQQNVDNVEN